MQGSGTASNRNSTADALLFGQPLREVLLTRSTPRLCKPKRVSHPSNPRSPHDAAGGVQQAAVLLVPCLLDGDAAAHHVHGIGCTHTDDARTCSTAHWNGQSSEAERCVQRHAQEVIRCTCQRCRHL